MGTPLEVPRLEDVADLGLSIETGDEPWVVSVTALASDDDTVVLTWDEIGASVQVRWTTADTTRLVLEREIASKISIHKVGDNVDFRVWSSSTGATGELVVHVGKHVTISDALLRT